MTLKERLEAVLAGGSDDDLYMLFYDLAGEREVRSRRFEPKPTSATWTCWSTLSDASPAR